MKLTDCCASAVEMNFTQKRGLSTLIPPKVKVLSCALKGLKLTAVDCLSECKPLRRLFIATFRESPKSLPDKVLRTSASPIYVVVATLQTRAWLVGTHLDGC